MKKTLATIYNWNKIENPETSLLKSINTILDKTPEELNSNDICLLLRQEMFLDLVIPLAINEIHKNPKVGDFYEYQMLVNLSNISPSLTEYKEQIIDLINMLYSYSKNAIFELKSDEEDFNKSIKRLEKKIQQS